MWILRHLPSLASLSLANNPVSSHDYPALVLAHLPRLAYLDHRRVTPQDHADALDLHRYICSRLLINLFVHWNSTYTYNHALHTLRYTHALSLHIYVHTPSHLVHQTYRIHRLIFSSPLCLFTASLHQWSRTVFYLINNNLPWIQWLRLCHWWVWCACGWRCVAYSSLKWLPRRTSRMASPPKGRASCRKATIRTHCCLMHRIPR